MSKPLSAAQTKMLRHVGEYALHGAPFRQRSECEYSAPVRRLLRRGLIAKQPHRWPHLRSRWVRMVMTTAGHAALAKSLNTSSEKDA